MFSKKLNKKLDKYHLLKHPFYKSWNEGKLTREIIKDYAEQYYQHVKAFPRYISATHSLCEDIEKRKILLENLNDEENRDADHPKLWKNFALAMGADAKKIEEVKADQFTKDLIDNFFKNFNDIICHMSYHLIDNLALHAMHTKTTFVALCMY